MTPEKIIWRGWAARYSPEERKLMPKSLREAEFIHELKARFDGVLSAPVVEAEQVCRTGLQQLLRDGDRWFVSIKNRTYFSTVEISAERAVVWRAMLGGSSQFPIPERVRLELDLRKDTA